METERDKRLTEYCGYLRAEAAMVDAEDGLDSCTTRACLLRGAADEIERLRKHCKEDAVLYVKAMNTIVDLEQQLSEVRSVLIEADSNLSAYGHGRPLEKHEAVRISEMCRDAYMAIN